MAATAVAVAAPLLLGHWGSAGHAVFAQTLAAGLWGVALAGWASLPALPAVPWRALAPLLLALGGVAVGVAGHAAVRQPPGGIWLGTLGVLAAAALAAIGGARAARHRPESTSRALMWGLVVAAFASLLVAALQLAAPGWAPSLWVAPARTPGRANANLDDPNQLAMLLLWAWLAIAAWTARAPLDPAVGPTTTASSQPPVMPGGGSFMLAMLLQVGVVATASRAGLLASMAVGLWSALDRRLPRPTAWLLWITALAGLAMTLGRAIVTPATSLGVGASLVRPGARGGVFMDTLELIRGAPLTGVGWMEFQLAWTLSPLGDRGPRYYDHPHNIVLGLVVELGLPLGLAICACLIWGALRLLARLRRTPPHWQPRARMLAALLGVVGLHSLFDAPFWYAYLLLPAAWAWGCLVGLQAGPPAPPRTAPGATARAHPALLAGGLALAAGALVAANDLRHALMPSASAPSRLFGYLADHHRALVAPDASPELFASARWGTLDTRLLAAWIAALERAGRQDQARFLMQRALEFRDPAFSEWLGACRGFEGAEAPSRCRPPERPLHWRELR
ncbi:MAG: O-antigen ligase C-terminal domain-containing protein [Rubrivivax sp.]|nr:O-antigen ligase C-terminal domain-containing protein [Rubrivivax sp.]